MGVIPATLVMRKYILEERKMGGWRQESLPAFSEMALDEIEVRLMARKRVGAPGLVQTEPVSLQHRTHRTPADYLPAVCHRQPPETALHSGNAPPRK